MSAAATGIRGWRWTGERHAADRRVIRWIAIGGGAVIAAGGTLSHEKGLIVAGALAVVALLAPTAPEFVLAFFLVAGGLKGAPWLSGVPIDLTVLTSAGVLVAMIGRAMRPGGVPRFPLATILGVGLAMFAVLGVLYSPAPDLALDKALRFETFTMVAFIAPLILIRTRAELSRLMVFLLLFSLLIALTAVKGPGSGEPLTIAGGRSEIEFALYASTGAVAAAYLALVSRSRWGALWLIPGAYLTKTVIAAGSRGVLLGTALALLVVGGMVIARSRVKILPIAVVFAGVLTIALFGAELAGPAAQKYNLTLFGGSTQSKLRKRSFLLDDGVTLASAYPMGLGTSGYQARTYFAYPHNAIIEVWDEQGIIGVALLVSLFVAAFRSSLRSRAGPLSPESILALGLLIVVLADAMVSQSYTQFRELWFAMGLALALPLMRAEPHEQQRRALS